MSLAWTYTALKQALQDWPISSSTPYLANLPSIIAMAERRLWGDLNIEGYDVTDSTLSTVANTATVAKPDGCAQVRSVDCGPEYLDQRTYDFCRNVGKNLTARQPLYYAELTTGEILLAPIPDAVYPLVFHFMPQTPAEGLSPGNEGPTWLSSVAPDALFAVCLAEAEHFLQEDDRYADYIAKYGNELLPRLRNELRDQIRAGYNPFKPAAAAAQG